MKNIINNITVVLICILIFITNIIIGTPSIENTGIITISVSIIFLIYLIIYKVILKNKYTDIIKKINMLDICVIILCLSPWIPIILNTAVNLEDSTNYAIRYLTVFIIYVLLKILIIQDKKYIKYIINLTIGIGLLSSFFGIQNLLNEEISKLLYKIGVPLMMNEGRRMIGNIGYANTFALSVFIPLVFSTEKHIRKGNYFFTAINLLFVSCILLSDSKAMYMILGLWVIVYSVLLRNKKDIIKFLAHIQIVGMLAIVYAKIFTYFYERKMNIEVWISLAVFMGIAVALNKIINIYLERKNIKLTKYIIVACLIIVIFFAIGLNAGVPLCVFENQNQEKYVEYLIPIEPNQKYVFDFETISKSLEEDIYLIQIIEEKRNLLRIENHIIEFGTFSGNKNITINTNEKTNHIRLRFISKYPHKQQGLKINSFKINGEEYILNYLYLPNKIVNLLSNFSGKSLSVTDRMTYYKDAFKLIEMNPWTGIGGKGWVHEYEKVKSETYFSREVHSFPIQIWLEFGIIAILSYAFINLFVLKYSFANIKNLKMVYMSLGAIVLHSVIDFDLSFFNMFLYMFIFLSIISSEKIIIKKK